MGGGWDPTDTATYTHRWVEGRTPQALLPILTGGWRVGSHRHCCLYSQVGGGWDPTGTAAYTHRWVEGGGDYGVVVLEGYNIVGDGTPQALLPILTGGWRVGSHRHCCLYSQVGGGWNPTGTAAYTRRWVEGGIPQVLLPIFICFCRVLG